MWNLRLSCRIVNWGDVMLHMSGVVGHGQWVRRKHNTFCWSLRSMLLKPWNGLLRRRTINIVPWCTRVSDEDHTVKYHLIRAAWLAWVCSVTGVGMGEERQTYYFIRTWFLCCSRLLDLARGWVRRVPTDERLHPVWISIRLATVL